MKLSEQLSEALGRAQIAIGQFVTVLAADGDEVVSGFVDAFDSERGIVVVKDSVSGTDSTYEVDSSKYDFVIREMIPPGTYDTDETKPMPPGRKNQKATDV